MKNSLSILLFLFCITSCNTSDLIIIIDSGNSDRLAIPIDISLNRPIDSNSEYYLKNIETGIEIPVDVIDSNSFSIFLDSLKSGEKAQFKLLKRRTKSHQNNLVSIEKTPEFIHVSVGEKELLNYHHQVALPPSGESILYAKSGFIHPIKSPNGTILTDDFPAGHLHQHAIYNAWANTTFRGKKVDFWNQLDSLGTILHKDITKIKTGKILSELQTTISHSTMEHGEVLEEKWNIRIYPVSTFFLFDIYSEQTNTANDTLFLNKYIYGGMALRGSREWNPDDSIHYQQPWKVLSDQGYNLENVNHTKAKWISVSGEISGKSAGVTVFGFPDNFRYPQHVRVHPSMPYWVFSPVVEEGFTIAPGETFKSKFRYLVHDGEADIKLINTVQENLSNPVKVTLKYL